MNIVKFLQILLYLLAIVFAVWAAIPPGPRGRRWAPICASWACFVAAFSLPLLASA